MGGGKQEMTQLVGMGWGKTSLKAQIFVLNGRKLAVIDGGKEN